MAMSARLRKLVLTAHIATSVAWLGALAAYLALDVTATVSGDLARVEAMYVAMRVASTG